MQLLIPATNGVWHADSTSAFITAEAQGLGKAVSSWGSTFAAKLLGDCRVDNAQYGVYSQRIGNSWLIVNRSVRLILTKPYCSVTECRLRQHRRCPGYWK